MIVTLISIAAVLLAGLAEWLHLRRSRRIAHLAFGPSGVPRGWVALAPFIRAASLGGLTWGLVTLYLIAPGSARQVQVPEGGYRHLVIAFDVSPSMQLADAGPTHQDRRAQRASEVLMSVLSRIALDQVRISVVAFYSGAKPVVVDTYDLEVVRNIISDLPLDYAFDIGKTKLLDGIRESATLAMPWQPASTTLLVVSDGDTIPESGMPELPRSIAQVLVLGVGDPAAGTYIDGHQSRQEAVTLRELAQRLHGVYHDANERHLDSVQLATLSRLMPLREADAGGRREAALAATCAGATLLALLPVALALCGASWQGGLRPGRADSEARFGTGLRKAVWRWLQWLINPTRGHVP
jgi:Ca-activated chloride channel family protein